MTEDQVAAAEALLNWFDSQDISPTEAVALMAGLIGTIIRCHNADETWKNKSVQLVDEMIRDAAADESGEQT